MKLIQFVNMCLLMCMCVKIILNLGLFYPFLTESQQSRELVRTRDAILCLRRLKSLKQLHCLRLHSSKAEG